MSGIKLTIKIDDAVTKMVEKLGDDIEDLKDEIHDEFVKNTPKRTGNARKKTRKRGDTIYADYPYAKRLDEGYSKQSPSGMTDPTLDFIEKRFEQIVKGK